MNTAALTPEVAGIRLDESGFIDVDVYLETCVPASTRWGTSRARGRPPKQPPAPNAANIEFCDAARAASLLVDGPRAAVGVEALARIAPSQAPKNAPGRCARAGRAP